MRYDDYIPEIDYEARDYTPIKGRVNHFCEDCVGHYNMMHDKGLTKKPFPFRYDKQDGSQIRTCRFDKRLDQEYIRREHFDTDEDYEEAMRTVDPVTWAYSELGWRPRWYQEEILCCTSQFKAIRAGRRVGKTASLSVLTLWYAVTHKNFQILVVCPFVAQVAKIMDNIRELIMESPDIANSVVRDVHSSPQIIQLANGAKIRGFAAGGSSSGKSDQIRGQDADLIVMDEVDYISDGDIEVIMAILTSNIKTEVVVSSTPRGLRSRLFEWTRDKDGRWKEFWYISAEGPAWSQETEDFYQQMYSGGGFAREFLAEFGEELQGVFRAKDLLKCIYDYKYEDMRPDHQNCTYTMGVDWNKHTGTHICVIERPKNGPISYKLVAKAIIRKSEFTQLEGVKAIMEIDAKWGCSYIYTDAGYGHTQIEMLWAEDLKNPLKQYRKRIKPIEMNGNIILRDPIEKKEIKKPAKPLMVYLAAHQVERHRVMFPRVEDTATQIVPEELAYSDIGVVQQARAFMVTKISPTGRETFSQDYEHTLTAWMLGIMAHLLEYGDYQKIRHTHKTGRVGPLGSTKTARPDINLRDEFGQELPPAQIQGALRAAEAMRQQEAAERAERLSQHTRKDWRDSPNEGMDLNGAALSDERNKGSSVTRLDGGVYVSHKLGSVMTHKDGVPIGKVGKGRWGRRAVNSSGQRDLYGRRLTRSGFNKRRGK